MYASPRSCVVPCVIVPCYSPYCDSARVFPATPQFRRVARGKLLQQFFVCNRRTSFVYLRGISRGAPPGGPPISTARGSSALASAVWCCGIAAGRCRAWTVPDARRPPSLCRSPAGPPSLPFGPAVGYDRGGVYIRDLWALCPCRPLARVWPTHALQARSRVLRPGSESTAPWPEGIFWAPPHVRESATSPWSLLAPPPSQGRCPCCVRASTLAECLLLPRVRYICPEPTFPGL